MAFPHSPDKHAWRPFVTPQRLVEHRLEIGRPFAPLPSTVLVTWQRSMFDRVKAESGHEAIEGPGGDYVRLSESLALGRLAVGAPNVAMALELFAVLGVKTVVGFGNAGALTDQLAAGDIVVCESAIRDEGTSHHYAPTGEIAVASSHILDVLRSAFPTARVGASWTTDAVYRETVEEVDAYRARGVLTVDMEAGAMFVVGSCLGLQTGAVFAVSDVLSGHEWEPHFHSDVVTETWWQIFETLVRTFDADGTAPTSICR